MTTSPNSKGWQRVLRLLLLMIASAFPDLAAAQEGQVRSVRVVVAGDQETTIALQAPIQALLSERLVQLSWTVQESIEAQDVLREREIEPGVLAHIWLDVSNSERARLYIVNAQSDRFLVRIVPLENAYDEITRESLGNIVESAIDALLDGDKIGVSRKVAAVQVERESGPPPDTPEPKEEETPAPLPVVPPPRKQPAPSAQNDSSVLDALLLGVRVDTLSATDWLRFGPELSAYLLGGKAAAISPFVWLSVNYRLPSTWHSDETQIEILGPGMRALFGATGARGDFRWRAALGAGLDVDRVETSSESADISANPAFWILSPLLTTMIAGQWKFSGPWFLSAAVGADLDLAGHHFDILRSDAVETVVKPWRLRPVASLALGFDFQP